VDFGLGAHAWRGRLGEAGGVWQAGALFLKGFTCTTHGVPGLMTGDLQHLFREAAALDAVCLLHCEDEFITADAEAALRAAGRADGGIIPEWRSPEAELAATNSVAHLAEQTGARVVIAHASHAAVIDLAMRSRNRGARLFVETCPQYLYLREDEVREHGAFRKFTPPARQRSSADAEALWDRIARGAVNHVATDHAPATKAQKREADIWDVHFGLPGVETTLCLLLHGAHEGRLSLPRLVEVLSEAPARLYGLYPRKGTLQIGADADVVVVDLARERVLRDEDVVSKAGWTPYAGRRVVGQPVMTFVRGRLVAEDRRPVGEPGWGRWVSRESPGKLSAPYP
jgi:dihydroorotase-like cyclic amidohydrolase